MSERSVTHSTFVIERTYDAAPDRVVVHVSAPVRLPITPPGWDRTPMISVTAASFVTVSD